MVERSIPIAQIEGLFPNVEGGNRILQRLVFEGAVQQARERPDRSILELEPITCEQDPVAALIQERDGR